MSFRVEKDVMVPMRDGVRLAADAWIPEGGGPVPVLLVRLPYGKDMIGLYVYGLAPNVFVLVEAGYAVGVSGLPGHVEVRWGVRATGQRAGRRGGHRGLAAGTAVV